jgi:hypothetical protein
MSDIEVRALNLAAYIQNGNGNGNVRMCPNPMLQAHLWEALCRAIEHHEAFKQEVSDDLVEHWKNPPMRFRRYVIPKPKPDPLVEVLTDTFGASLIDADELRAALKDHGLEIRPCE